MGGSPRPAMMEGVWRAGLDLREPGKAVRKKGKSKGGSRQEVREVSEWEARNISLWLQQGSFISSIRDNVEGLSSVNILNYISVSLQRHVTMRAAGNVGCSLEGPPFPVSPPLLAARHLHYTPAARQHGPIPAPSTPFTMPK
ncbi:hypothetical protein O3P69_015467 [Scylla paramamosain]|uniref:Uncharacterized protein n=1 Tax=Scylla paramamosain TaxID=85552 RepID=A0AAW0T523_SCYPA